MLCMESHAQPAAAAADPCHGLGTCDAGLSRAFELLGKRWSGVLLGTLSQHSASFSDLRRAVQGITDSVLSDRLSELAEAGLVLRSVTDNRPPSVSYSLTPAGTNLLPILGELSAWAEQNLAARG